MGLRVGMYWICMRSPSHACEAMGVAYINAMQIEQLDALERLVANKVRSSGSLECRS